MSALEKIDFSALADQFRGLNPNDVATWPILPRIAALSGLFVATLIAGWWFFWNGQLTELTEKEMKEESLKQEFLEKKKKAVNLDLYVQQLNEIDQTFGALLKQLPNRSEMDALLTEINQAGLGRGLQFELFRPGTEQTKDFYAELPIQVKLSGTYHEFGAFAADIAKLSRIVTLNDMSITPGAGGKLTLDAVVKTFRYLDQEELAKVKAASKAAKGGHK